MHMGCNRICVDSNRDFSERVGKNSPNARRAIEFSKRRKDAYQRRLDQTMQKVNCRTFQHSNERDHAVSLSIDRVWREGGNGTGGCLKCIFERQKFAHEIQKTQFCLNGLNHLRSNESKHPHFPQAGSVNVVLSQLNQD